MGAFAKELLEVFLGERVQKVPGERLVGLGEEIQPAYDVRLLATLIEADQDPPNNRIGLNEATVTPPDSTLLTRKRSYTRVNGCESGHWVDSVLSDGEVVKLEDGSIWQIDSVDTVDSSLWLETDDVTVCDGKLINTDDHSSVGAHRLK